MAFKMNGFNAGQGTGSGAAFKKAQQSSPLTKPPAWADGVPLRDRKGSGVQKGQVWTKIGTDSEGADEFGFLDKKDARKSERKTSKAEKLRGKAEKLRAKGKVKKAEGKEEKANRLNKRAKSKDIRATVKEDIASNIQQGKPKKANLVDPRGGQTPGYKHRVVNPKKHDADGKHIKGTGKKKIKAPAPKKEMAFGDAFKAARAANKAKFTWKGKSYHTRRADESKADWQKKFNTTNPSPGKEPTMAFSKKKTKLKPKK